MKADSTYRHFVGGWDRRADAHLMRILGKLGRFIGFA